MTPAQRELLQAICLLPGCTNAAIADALSVPSVSGNLVILKKAGYVVGMKSRSKRMHYTATTSGVQALLPPAPPLSPYATPGPRRPYTGTLTSADLGRHVPRRGESDHLQIRSKA